MKRIALVAALGLVGALTPLHAASAAAPAPYTNCTSYNKKFPHGVGKKKAVDKSSGRPVTTFRRDDAEYARAMKANRGLDRDKDGVACEKR